ncbi:plant self-incompatibility S1, partial [Tanacetum coccineum]
TASAKLPCFLLPKWHMFVINDISEDIVVHVRSRRGADLGNQTIHYNGIYDWTFCDTGQSLFTGEFWWASKYQSLNLFDTQAWKMSKAASDVFGELRNQRTPNVFGELMRILMSPTEKPNDSVLIGGSDPDITLHMPMLMNRSQGIEHCRERPTMTDIVLTWKEVRVRCYLHREREEEDYEDDGTSSTKKWKRKTKEPAEASEEGVVTLANQAAVTSTDQGAVTLAYQGASERTGFDLSYDLNIQLSGIHEAIVLDDKLPSQNILPNEALGLAGKLVSQNQIIISK